MRRLTGLESFFVSAETATNLFHVGALTVLDPTTRPAGSPDPQEALCRVIEERLHLLAPFGRRLVTVPGGLDHPRWVEDRSFDVRRHVLRAALPEPAGHEELARFAADVMARPLDRDRPLWEIHVVEGLRDGLVAAVAKIHHAAIDGLTGVELTANLMDLTPRVRSTQPATGRREGDDDPRSAALALSALAQVGARIPAAGRVVAGAVRAARRMRISGAPKTDLGGRITRRRSVATATVGKEDFDRIRAATGATFNDAVLGVTSTALRQHLADGDVLPDAPLVAFVPVALRDQRGTGHDESVNRLSGMVVPLATDVDDPLERLVAITIGAERAKLQEAQVGGAFFGTVAELMVPLVAGLATRALSLAAPAIGWPPFNVVVSSFPGSPAPLYCGGSRLVAYYPLGPVIDGAPLNVTVTTYRDEISFGLLACEDSVPEVDAIAARIPDAARQLVKAAAAA